MTALSDEEALSRIAASVDAITAEVDREMGIHPPPPW